MGGVDNEGMRPGAGQSEKYARGMQTEGVGAEQRGVQPTAVGEAWEKMKYGTGSGK